MKTIALIIALALMFVFSQASVQAHDWTESIKLNFGLDPKDWEVGFNQKTETGYIVEFVPKGQTVENWNELITLNFFPGLEKRVDCDEFAEGFVDQLKESDPKIKVTVIKAEEDNTIFEWSVNGSTKNPDQDELDRVIRGKQGLHMVHYVKKCKSFTEAERIKWLKFLDSATLVDSK